MSSGWGRGASSTSRRGAGSVIPEEESERTARTSSDWVLLRRLTSFLLARRRDLTYVGASVAVFTVTSVLGPVVIGMAIDSYIYPNGALGADIEGLAVTLAIFIALTLGTYATEHIQTYYMARAGQTVIYTLRREAFERLQKLSQSYFNDRAIGAVISHVTNDVDVLNDFLAFQSTQLISGFFAITGIAIVMLVISVPLALYSLTMIPLLVLLIYSLQGRIKSNWMDTRTSTGVLNAKVAESLAGIKITQSFAAEGEDRHEFITTNYKNFVANVRAAKLSAFIAPMARVIQALSIFAVFYFGGVMVAGGTLQLGVLAAFYIWLNNLFRPIQQLTQFYPQYQSALTGLDRVLQIIDAPIDVKESAEAAELPERVSGVVDFRHVSFRYKSGDTNALTDIDLHVPSREIVAIVGETGAGKTTFVNLLFRFYDPTQGEVMVDGRDTSGLTFRSLRRHMALVLQEPFLFSDTVMANIRYGNLAASDEEVVRAAKEVGLHQFISDLPQGYYTFIRESANNLSTGQKQLISLARALIADPEILVLDEATSKLDPYTELVIQRALDRVFTGRTTFIIAHRLSTIRMASRVLVFDHGRIVEEGAPAELLQREDGAYARLHRMQFQQERAA